MLSIYEAQIGVLIVLCLLVAIMLFPFTPARVHSLVVNHIFAYHYTKTIVTLVLVLGLVIKLIAAWFEMRKYAEKKEEVEGGQDHFAKQDVLLHKFRYERNFYIDAFTLVLFFVAWRSSYYLKTKLRLLEELSKASKSA